MRLLLDQNLSPRLVAALADLYPHEADLLAFDGDEAGTFLALG